MRIVLKKNGFFGVKRTALNAKIIEITANKDEKDKEGLSILFKGPEGFGAISIHPEEIDKITRALSKTGEKKEVIAKNPGKSQEKKSLKNKIKRKK